MPEQILCVLLACKGLWMLEEDSRTRITDDYELQCEYMGL